MQGYLALLCLQTPLNNAIKIGSPSSVLWLGDRRTCWTDHSFHFPNGTLVKEQLHCYICIVVNLSCKWLKKSAIAREFHPAAYGDITHCHSYWDPATHSQQHTPGQPYWLTLCGLITVARSYLPLHSAKTIQISLTLSQKYWATLPLAANS